MSNTRIENINLNFKANLTLKKPPHARFTSSSAEKRRGEASLILSKYRQDGGRLPRQLSSNGYDLNEGINEEEATCELLLLFENAFSYPLLSRSGKYGSN